MKSISEHLEELVEHLDILLENSNVLVIDVDQIRKDLEYLKVHAGRRIPKELDGLHYHLQTLSIPILCKLYLYHLNSALSLQQGHLILHARFLIPVYFGIGIKNIGIVQQIFFLETIAVECVEDFLVEE